MQACVLLTGTTGVLGARILKDLLDHSTSKIYCLVRGDSIAEATKRVQNFLAIYDQSQKLHPAFHERVTLVLGDISSASLGLSPQVYQSLTQKIDLTIHAAASTNLFLSYRRIEKINVFGVKQIVDFVLATEAKRLHYISTFTVIGNKLYDPDVVFSESHLDIGQSFEDMSYQKSKFTAEQLVRESSKLGLKWNIYRPGQIFGDSETGAYPNGKTNVGGLFLDIFKTVIETGIAFQSEGHFDMTPVDFVSRAILFFALTRDIPFETYHLLNPHPETYTGVIQLLSQEGYPIKPVLQSEYKTMLENRSLNYKSVTTQAFKSWLSRSNFDFRETARIDSRFTTKLLAENNIFCPPINQELMHTYVQYGIKEGYFPNRSPAK